MARSSALGAKGKDLSCLALGALHAEPHHLHWSSWVPFLVHGEKGHFGGGSSSAPFCTEEMSSVMEEPIALL